MALAQVVGDSLLGALIDQGKSQVVEDFGEFESLYAKLDHRQLTE